MLAAVEAIILNESFQVQLEPAITAHRQAVRISKWVHQGRDNELTFMRFEENVKAKLQKCIEESTLASKALQTQKLDMMRKYYELRTSESFYRVWNELTIAATGMEAIPVFFSGRDGSCFSENDHCSFSSGRCWYIAVPG